MSLPRQGDFAPERRCSRLLGYDDDGSERVCGADPVSHICWRDLPETGGLEPGWACAEHMKEIGSVWKPHSHHPVGACCGMPGAKWIMGENVCRYTDGLPTAEPVRVVAEPIPLSTRLSHLGVVPEPKGSPNPLSVCPSCPSEREARAMSESEVKSKLRSGWCDDGHRLVVTLDHDTVRLAIECPGDACKANRMGCGDCEGIGSEGCSMCGGTGVMPDVPKDWCWLRDEGPEFDFIEEFHVGGRHRLDGDNRIVWKIEWDEWEWALRSAVVPPEHAPESESGGSGEAPKPEKSSVLEPVGGKREHG